MLVLFYGILNTGFNVYGNTKRKGKCNTHLTNHKKEKRYYDTQFQDGGKTINFLPSRPGMPTLWLYLLNGKSKI